MKKFILGVLVFLFLVAAAGIKIRDLTLDTTPADTDMLPVAKASGVTVKQTRAMIRSGLAAEGRNISTTAPLSGGGNLTADRTLSLALGAGPGDLATVSSALQIDRSQTLASNTLPAGYVAMAATGMLFEAATANAFEGYLTSTDVNADRTWTLPNRSGIIITNGDTGTVTGLMIDDAYAGRSLTETSNTLDVDAELYTATECSTILSPATGTTLFWRTPYPITATRIDCLVNASTSATATIQACDANGASCSNLNAALTCGTTTASAAPPTTTAIASGIWLRVNITATSGLPGHLGICLTYTVND